MTKNMAWKAIVPMQSTRSVRVTAMSARLVPIGGDEDRWPEQDGNRTNSEVHAENRDLDKGHAGVVCDLDGESILKWLQVSFRSALFEGGRGVGVAP